VLYAFWVDNLRLVSDVQVRSGKQYTSVHAKTSLARLLDELQDRRPARVRGDAGYAKTGTARPSPFCACDEGILLELESRKQPYLLRLRQTANLQRLVARLFERQDWSRPDSQGCQVVQDNLQMHGWRKKRRVVVARQRVKGGISRERRVNVHRRKLNLAGASAHEGERLWEYAVTVTDVNDPIETVAQLNRDRADCRICQVSGFDELKNQWSRAPTRSVLRTGRARRGVGPVARYGLHG